MMTKLLFVGAGLGATVFIACILCLVVSLSKGRQRTEVWLGLAALPAILVVLCLKALMLRWIVAGHF